MKHNRRTYPLIKFVCWRRGDQQSNFLMISDNSHNYHFKKELVAQKSGMCDSILGGITWQVSVLCHQFFNVAEGVGINSHIVPPGTTDDLQNSKW